jgi:hypothetical protein
MLTATSTDEDFSELKVEEWEENWNINFQLPCARADFYCIIIFHFFSLRDKKMQELGHIENE